jgi:hypothetical protein
MAFSKFGVLGLPYRAGIKVIGVLSVVVMMSAIAELHSDFIL